MPLPRRRHVPPEVRAALGDQLEPGEKVMAAGHGPSGYAVATVLGLWHQPGGDEPFTRLDWHLVDRVVWRDGVLRIEPSPVDGRPGPDLVLALTEPGRLPGMVRDRVERSIVFSERSPVGIRVVGRLRPRDAGYEWSVRYDPGVDPEDPAVRRQVQALLDRARSDRA